MIATHLADLTDDELRQATITVRDDLAQAAADQPNTEWHEACFAGAMVYAGEMQRRGLKIATVH